MIKILRPVRDTPLISASVFEALFKHHLGDVLAISSVPLVAFCDEILGPWDAPYHPLQAVEKFLNHTKEYDFFCPAYECMGLAPLFISLRNSSGSDIRLLFIAHSAGAYAMEWALLRPMLVPGDVIVAPSQCARQTIHWLCPEVSPFVKVIHHPIGFLPKPVVPQPGKHGDIRIVTLGRIEPSKLVHRQVEAAHILVKRGLNNVRMHIAGPLEDPLTGEPTIYARSLKAKIRRLKLEDHVFLEGLIKGEQEKSNFLAGAHMSLNLSNSIEESLPKSSIEPLGLGIPVIACLWNGFVETVGNCGKWIPLTEMVDGFLDVLPEHIADAIEALLAHPVPPAQCIRQAKKYLPLIAKKQYLATLTKAQQDHPSQATNNRTLHTYDGKITDTQGLIGKLACLKPFNWREMMVFHQEYSSMVRASWQNQSSAKIGHEEILRELVILSIYSPLSYFYAKKNHEKWSTAVGPIETIEAAPANHLDFFRRVAESAITPSIISSKIAIIYALSKKNEPALLAQCLDLLETHGLPDRTKNYYRTEVDFQLGNYVKAFGNFARKNQEDRMTSYDSQSLRQIARICQHWGKPGSALPWLRTWLEKFPDEPDSGSIWLLYAYNLLYQGDTIDVATMTAILDTVKELLGTPPYVRELAQQLLLFQCVAVKNKVLAGEEENG